MRATQEILATQGSAATVELVAEHAEIAVSTVYKHFPTKAALFESAFLAGMREWEEWAQATLPTTAGPVERWIIPMRLLMKVPQTHPLFAQTVAQNPEVFIAAVPKMNFGIVPEAIELHDRTLIHANDLDLRLKNLIMVLTLTFVELCTNPDGTEEQALAGVSVALEMLGFKWEQINDLMHAPLPDFRSP